MSRQFPLLRLRRAGGLLDVRLLSELKRRDVGLDAAIDAYLAEGAPAPELPAPDALPEDGPPD